VNRGASRLYLMRHAKSSWDDPSLGDHDRPLAGRGRRAAKLIADHMRSEAISPSLVVCSSALRTRQTLEGIAPALDAPEVSIEREIYGASAAALLDRLRRIGDETGSAMLIGHQPAIRELTLSLAGDGVDLARVRAKFPTAALATLLFVGEWSTLSAGSAELVEYVKPKELAAEL
jgi:phosphohistidine phosphatase